MSIFFIVQRGPEIGKRYDLLNAVITIGRSEDNDISFDDPYMSRYHAVIKQAGGQMQIIDLGSENAVQVRETALEAGEPYTLQNRDILRIGQNILCFVDSSQLPARPAPSVSSASDNTRIAPLVEPKPAQPQPAEYTANWRQAAATPPPINQYPPQPNPLDANYARMMNPTGTPPPPPDDDAAPTLPPVRPAVPGYNYQATNPNSIPSAPTGWQANYPPAVSYNDNTDDEDATIVGIGPYDGPTSDSEATQLASYTLPATGRPDQSHKLPEAKNAKVEPELDPGDAPTTIIRLDKNKI